MLTVNPMQMGSGQLAGLCAGNPETHLRPANGLAWPDRVRAGRQSPQAGWHMRILLHGQRE